MQKIRVTPWSKLSFAGAALALALMAVWPATGQASTGQAPSACLSRCTSLFQSCLNLCQAAHLSCTNCSISELGCERNCSLTGPPTMPIPQLP